MGSGTVRKVDGGNLMANRICLPALVSVLLMGFLAGGCTSEAERLQAFLQERRTPVSGVPYRVLPPDVILVRSTYVPEIDGISQQIRPDGKINLPLVGELDVVGKNETGLTPTEIEDQITQASKDYYERVDATVQVVGFNSQKVYVFGQVAGPGPQQWTGTNTLLDVLAQSQPTMLAWPQRILLVRGKPPRRGGYLLETDDLDQIAGKAGDGESAPDEVGTVVAKVEPKEDGAEEKKTPATAVPEKVEAKVMRVNLMAMIKKGDMSKNVYLQPDDVIYVPANPLAAVGLALQQVLLPIRPAAETIAVPASAAYSATRVGGGGSY